MQKYIDLSIGQEKLFPELGNINIIPYVSIESYVVVKL